MRVADFTDADGVVKDLEGFKKVWEDCDFTLDNHLSFYCGTGWRATGPFLVLYENGYDDISVYDGGWYESGGMSLLISRGLGGHGPVPRVFNKPELIVLDIE